MKLHNLSGPDQDAKSVCRTRLLRAVFCTSRLRWQRQRRKIWPRRSLHRYNSKANTKVYQCLNTFRLVHTCTLEHTGRNSRGGSSEQERSADRRGNGRAEAAQSVCRDQSFHQCCCWGFFYLASDSRCETSWVPSQLGLSQLWDPTHLFRS